MNPFQRQVKQRLVLNAPLAVKVLTSFIRDAVETAGMEGVVIGLSGGVDSSLSAALAALALGPDRVHGFLMPYRTSSAESEKDARVLAEHLGVPHRLIDISPMVDAYFAMEPDADPGRRGNKMARERMTILFDQAKKLNALVLGTSNKTEILLGYSTVFGDNAELAEPAGRPLQGPDLAALAPPGPPRAGDRQGPLGGPLARPDGRGGPGL